MFRLYFLIFIFVSSSLFSTVGSPASPGSEDRLADRALEGVEQDVVQVEHDLVTLVIDLMHYVVFRAPSGGTLLTDATVDASLRKIPAFSKAIKELEKTNPTNGAVVRDGTKLATIFWKMFAGIPVDQSGRKYELSDTLTQSTKFGGKGILFFIASYVGYMDNQLVMFSINTIGDLGSQIFQEVGEGWRKHKSKEPYLSYFSANWKEGFSHSLNSIPVKAAVGNMVGGAIKWIELDYKVGNWTEWGYDMAINSVSYLTPEELQEVPGMLLVVLIPVARHSLYQTGNASVDVFKYLGAAEKLENITYAIGNGTDNVIGHLENVSSSDVHLFIKGWLVEFARSIAKSLVLTTGCKVAMDITRQINRHPTYGRYVKPTILGATAIVFAIF